MTETKSKDLRSFLKGMENNPQLLVKCKKQINTKFEISALIKNIGAGIGGDDNPSAPAIYFENVEGSTMHVVSNLFGSRKLLAAALDAQENNLTAKLNESRSLGIEPQTIEDAPIHNIQYLGKEAT